ncbi:MAG: AtpZ/AtpI family protein [Andreesenia angusta]|nr:AtpZ/AtpI family protein [Andreesenia angusta]
MKRKTSIFANLTLVTQIGITVIIILIGCIFLGKFLDEKLGTDIIFLIVFTVIGVLSAFNYIFRIGMQGAGSNRKTTVNYDKREIEKLKSENRKSIEKEEMLKEDE